MSFQRRLLSSNLSSRTLNKQLMLNRHKAQLFIYTPCFASPITPKFRKKITNLQYLCTIYSAIIRDEFVVPCILPFLTTREAV